MVEVGGADSIVVAHFERLERTEEAKRRAIADGVPTFDRIPLGYLRRRGPNGRFLRAPLEVDPGAGPLVREAFWMRAAGATIAACGAYLRERGIEVSYSRLTGMFKNRIYVGELRFGPYVNLHAHAPLIDRATFQRVQRLSLPRGRKPKSDRLLARLGVLRCATCGARMVVGQARANGRDYPMYRCPPNGDCPRRVTISARIVEQAVVDAAQRLLSDIQGSASFDDAIAEGERELLQAGQELDAAVRAFSGVEDVQAVNERLLELREIRDTAQSRLDDLRAATAPSFTVDAGHWDLLNLEERQALIQSVIARVAVAPGRGLERVTIEARGRAVD